MIHNPAFSEYWSINRSLQRFCSLFQEIHVIGRGKVSISVSWNGFSEALLKTISKFTNTSLHEADIIAMIPVEYVKYNPEAAGTLSNGEQEKFWRHFE